MRTRRHAIPIGNPVRVKFETGFFGDLGTFYRSGWRAGEVVEHSRIGEARRAGGYPTYDVVLRDGNLVRNCAPECVERVRKGARR